MLLIIKNCAVFHSDPQSPVDSPHVSPVPGPQPVSATRVEEVEMKPRSVCPIPMSNSSLSVASSISAWELLAAQESRQGCVSPSTPVRTLSPASSSVSRARRRAFCCGRKEEEARSPSPIFHLNSNERYYRVSD